MMWLVYARKPSRNGYLDQLLGLVEAATHLELEEHLYEFAVHLFKYDDAKIRGRYLSEWDFDDAAGPITIEAFALPEAVVVDPDAIAARCRASKDERTAARDAAIAAQRKAERRAHYEELKKEFESDGT